MRIVSLLPSATEIICELGLREQLVGVTHECDWPPSVTSLPKVTNTLIPTNATSAEIDALVRERMGKQSALYTLDMEMLERLQPDLIITQALCDVCAVAEEEVKSAACRLASLPGVVNLEPETLDEVFAAILQVAKATHRDAEGADAVAKLRARVERITSRTRTLLRPRVALLEWIDPPFSTGHWNPELVRLAGGVDDLGQEGSKSVTLSWDRIVAYQPEVVVISCCGFTIERTLQEVGILSSVPGWDDIPAVREARVWIADGSSYFSRPSQRLVDSLELLAHVIHPQLFDLPDWVTPPVRPGHRERSEGSALIGADFSLRSK